MKKYSFERNSGDDVNIVAKKKKKKGFGLIPRLLCLVVAMLIWLYVMYTRRTDFEVVLEDVPIELVGEEKILEDHGLAVVSDHFTVDITVRGKKSVIGTYTHENVKVSADISDISDEGKFTADIVCDMPEHSFVTVKTNIKTVTVTAAKAALDNTNAE